MKAILKTERTLPFFDSAAEIGLDPFVLQILDPTGVEVAVLAMNQVVSAPNLFLSDAFSPQDLGQYQLIYKYGDPLAPIFYTTLEVGAAPISDFPLGTPVDIVLDDNILGGPGQPITAHLYDGAGQSLSATSFASFIGDEPITTIPVSNNDSLTLQVLPDPNAVGAQTVTFLCASTVAVGGAAGNYAGTSAGDTATYQIDGGIPRTLDLSAVAAGQVNYINALNAQLRGASARDDGGGITTLVTDSQGSSSEIVLSNFGGTFGANTGLSEATYAANGAANNVGDSDAVTFLELKLLIETGVMDGAQGDRVLVTLEEDTDNLVLSATSGVAGNLSQIDLTAGTASVLSSLGLTSLGTQGGGLAAIGSDGISVQALYSALVDGYVIQNKTFNAAQEVFVVWLNNNVQTYMTDYLITSSTDTEVVNVYAAEINPTYPNGNPHIAATVIASTPAGVQITQGVTDVSGYVRLELPPGDHILTLSKANTVFSLNNFEKEVFNSSVVPADDKLYSPPGASDVQAIQLITDKFNPTITAPPAPADMCTLFATLYLMDGTPLRHAAINVGLLDRPQLYSGTAVIDSQKIYKTDSNGYVEFSIVQGLQIEVNIAPLSVRRRITVPSSAGPVNIMTLLSSADDPFDIITPNIVAAPKRTL